MKKIVLSLFIFGLAFSSTSQVSKNDTLEYKAPKHFVGLHAGFTTGVGISYRFWPNKLGVQLTAAPIFTSNKTEFISLGLSALLKFTETENFTVYSYLGNHLFFTGYSKPLYNIGIGGGFKHNFLKTMDINIQLGYGVYSVSESANINSSLTGEIGIYYQL